MIIFDKKLYVSLTCQKTSHNYTKIAFKPLHTNLFNIVLLSFFLSLGCGNLYSQEIKNKKKPLPAAKQTDKPKITVAEKAPAPILDTIKLDTVKPKKNFLDAVTKYKAKDYAKYDKKARTLTLYNEAELYYKDVELKSGIIVLNLEKDEVYAGRIRDSAGVLTQYPNFKQGASEVQPDSIRFNFKTKKALIYNSRTEQGEFK
ncbi:MAG: LPS-assembly protein LptD, partial [Flavobacterium sp.]